MNATARVDAIVVSDNYLIYDIIVGRDFLEQEHVVVIKRGNELLIKQLSTINDECEDIVISVCFSETQTEGNICIRVGDKRVEQQCVELIREFRDCVSHTIKDLGRTDAISLSIRCTSDIPVVYRPYRLAEAEKRTLRDLIQELLDNNIIRESNSPYASPILLVKKKDRRFSYVRGLQKIERGYDQRQVSYASYRRTDR